VPDRTTETVATSLTVASTAYRDLCEFIQTQVTDYVRRQIDPASAPVSLDKSFSAVGLDSLGAATVGLAIEKRTGVRLTPEHLYEYQTISDLAGYVLQRQESDRHTPCEVICEQPLCEHQPGICPQQRGVPPMVLCAASADAGCPQDTRGKTQRANFAPGRDPLDYFRERNRRIDVMRSQDLYFYETPISALDGPWAEVDGRRLLILSSYSYLGLIGHPEVNAAAKEAIDCFGTGAHGVRLISGTTVMHRRLEQALSEFLQAEDAVVYNSGYITNLANDRRLGGTRRLRHWRRTESCEHRGRMPVLGGPLPGVSPQCCGFPVAATRGSVRPSSVGGRGCGLQHGRGHR
jgi:acyl carrier protein